MFEPLYKTPFLDPSSFLTSCYWTWWSAIPRISAFMLLLGNTRRGGTYVMVAFIQVTTVTNKPPSAEDKETHHLHLREIT